MRNGLRCMLVTNNLHEDEKDDNKEDEKSDQTDIEYILNFNSYLYKFNLYTIVLVINSYRQIEKKHFHNIIRLINIFCN